MSSGGGSGSGGSSGQRQRVSVSVGLEGGDCTARRPNASGKWRLIHGRDMG